MKVRETKSITATIERLCSRFFSVFILVAFSSDAPVTFFSDKFPLKSAAVLQKRGRQTGDTEGANEPHEKKGS